MTPQDIQRAISYLNSIRNMNRIWIEAEMRAIDKNKFDTKYQTLTKQTVPANSTTHPYYVWSPNATPNNKWGIELRIYFVSDNSVPIVLSNIAKNNSRDGYRQYDKRINKNELIWQLFANGFVLGSN